MDCALADYLNSYEDKSALQVMFVRLQPGIYSFGSKKVCVKVENQKINIRIGGGYMRINEFLEKYTTIELDRSIRDGIEQQPAESTPIKSPSKKMLHKVNTGE